MDEGRVLLIDKPAGISSFGVVAEVRRKLRARKVGHAGTLDPMATGLLVLGVGKATKRLGAYLKLPKEYVATIRLGLRTDTGDVTGVVAEQMSVEDVQREKVEAVLATMMGKLALPVPIYSAIKRGGESLYKKARRGEKVEPPVRTMEITSADFIDLKLGEGYVDVEARFAVGSGTYIRSLAEELGRRLGYPATLAALRRTRIGVWRVEDALQVSEIEK